jgi:hypothetical protein
MPRPTAVRTSESRCQALLRHAVLVMGVSNSLGEPGISPHAVMTRAGSSLPSHCLQLLFVRFVLALTQYRIHQHSVTWRNGFCV